MAKEKETIKLNKLDKGESKPESESTAKAQISGEMLIGDVVSRWPETATIMSSHGLHCIGCHVSNYESVEAGALGHGMEKSEIGMMLNEMNEIALKNRGKDMVISDSAAKKLSELMESEGKKGWGLKFIVERQGCSGFGYAMDFAEKPSENEKTIAENGMNIFVEKDVFPMVKGTRIDYIEGMGSGFRIQNPNKV